MRFHFRQCSGVTFRSPQLLASPCVPSTEGRREAGISHRLSLLLSATEKCHGDQHPPKVECQGEVGSPIPILMRVIFHSLKPSPTERCEFLAIPAKFMLKMQLPPYPQQWASSSQFLKHDLSLLPWLIGPEVSNSPKLSWWKFLQELDVETREQSMTLFGSLDLYNGHIPAATWIKKQSKHVSRE